MKTLAVNVAHVSTTGGIVSLEMQRKESRPQHPGHGAASMAWH